MVQNSSSYNLRISAFFSGSALLPLARVDRFRLDERLKRHDLPDEQRERLAAACGSPVGPPVERLDSDHGIMFRARTGCPWRNLPPEYGNWKTVYNRHRRWSLDGTWEPGWPRVGCDEAEGRDRTVSADSTVVRAHQHAFGVRRARESCLGLYPVRPSRSTKAYPWLRKYLMMVGRARTVAGLPAGWLCISTTGCARAPPSRSARLIMRSTQ
jgi:transposase